MISRTYISRLIDWKRIWFFLLTLLAGWLTANLVQAAETEMGHISGDIFAKKSKWWHGYISLSESYDDNIFNTEDDPESDLITVISPGFQLTLPGTKQRAEEIVTGTTTPGGLVFGRFRETSFRRFKAYLGYAPWFQFYADHPDENVVNHAAQAGIQFNFKGGLSLDAVDRLDRNYDPFEADTSTQTTDYLSNLVLLSAAFPLSPKLRFRADYSHFSVAYDNKAPHALRDRADNTASGYLYFQIRPGTDLFISYQYTDIAYDTDTIRNSVEQDYTGGIRYELTSKTNLHLQTGYGIRTYENTDIDDSRRLICTARLNYAFSAKTEIGLTVDRGNEESSVSTYNDTTTTAATFNLRQSLNYKWDVTLNAAYKYYDYHAGETELTGISDRTDTRITITPALSYTLNQWLAASLAYSHRRLNSDLEDNSYTGRQIMVKLTGSI